MISSLEIIYMNAPIFVDVDYNNNDNNNKLVRFN